MGFTSKLADLFVQFSATGVDALKNALEEVKGQLVSVQKAAELVGTGTLSRFKALKASLTELNTGGSLAVRLAGVKEAQENLAALTERLAKIPNKLLIRLGAEGVERLRAELDAIGGRLGELRGKLEGEIVGKGLMAAAKEASRLFDKASSSLLSFIRVGLSGTTTGERLAFQMQMISREIANLFLPYIEMLSNALARLIGWFRSLTGEQQDTIAKWTLFGLGALGAVAAIAKIITSVAALKKALDALAISQAIVSALSGPLGWANLAAAAAVGAGVFLATRGPQEEEGKTSTRRNQLTPSGGGFVAIQDVFRQIAMATIRQGESEIARKQLETQQAQLQELRRLNEVDRLKNNPIRFTSGKFA
jgi:hypothetical protein